VSALYEETDSLRLREKAVCETTGELAEME
jgi:hypothetical protein